MTALRRIEKRQRNVLVFEKRDLARGHIKALLFRLCEEGAFVDCEFRIVDERIVQVVILLSEVLLL